MGDVFWIKEWAKVRQAELVRLPESFEIHESFLSYISKEEFDLVFREAWNIFNNLYSDIAEFPQSFEMPMYKVEEYIYSTKEAREARNAAYRPVMLLYYLLISGEFNNDYIIVDMNKFRKINDVKKLPIMFERLSDYGFYFEGLKNNKITMDSLCIEYPDNKQILVVLKLLADKAYNTSRVKDFLACHYKLLQDDMNTVKYGFGVDMVADKLHTKEEREFVYTLDKVLSEMGYFSGSRESNEGPGYAYYIRENEVIKKGAYHYLMSSNKTKLLLYLRIRSVAKCIEYLKDCPDSVKRIFLWSDIPCPNRAKGTCIHGQEYGIDGKTYWRCGCCNAHFHFSPKLSDIPHYIKLVDLGLKK